MGDDLTDTMHDWSTKFTSVNTRAGAAAAGAAAAGADLSASDAAAGAAAAGADASAPDAALTIQQLVASNDTAAQPQQTGPGKGPVKTATGAQVLKILALIPSQKPITVPGGVMGDVTLVPGANIDGKILVVAAPLYVYYIDGVDCWEAYTPDFIRDLWLTSFAKGASRAAWLVPLIKAEMAFIEALLGPVWVIVVVDLVEWLAFYDEHKAQIKTAIDNFSTFNNARLEFKSRFPTLYDKAFSAALESAFVNFPKGVTGADVAYLVGRILGTAGLLGKAEKGIEITAKVVVTIIAEYVALVTILHAPGIIAGGQKAAAAETAKQLQAELAKAGIDVSPDDAVKIAHELADNSGATDVMKKLQAAAEALNASIGVLGTMPGQSGLAAATDYSEAAAILASTSSRPSAAAVASMRGLAVLPVSAARSGCATWPSFRPVARRTRAARRRCRRRKNRSPPAPRRASRSSSLASAVSSACGLRLHRQRQRHAPGTPPCRPVPPASLRAPSDWASAPARGAPRRVPSARSGRWASRCRISRHQPVVVGLRGYRCRSGWSAWRSPSARGRG